MPDRDHRHVAVLLALSDRDARSAGRVAVDSGITEAEARGAISALFSRQIVTQIMVSGSDTGYWRLTRFGAYVQQLVRAARDMGGVHA